MNKKTYIVTYNYQDIAEVEINHDTAEPFLREMVEFWSDSEERIAEADGNCSKAWLRQLCGFIIGNKRLPYPREDEGWVDILSGKHGIRVVDWSVLTINEDEIDVEEKQEATA